MALLLDFANRLGDLVGRHAQEEVMVIEIAIDAASDLCGLRTVGWASSLKEYHQNHAAYVGISVRSKPSEAGSGTRASSGFAENLLFAEIHTKAARSAIAHGSGHT